MQTTALQNSLSYPETQTINSTKVTNPSDQKIKPIKKQSLLRWAVKFSAIASGFLLSMGTLFTYTAYAGCKKFEFVDKDTSFFDFIKKAGILLKNTFDSTSAFNSNHCSHNIKNNLERLKSCSNYINNELDDSLYDFAILGFSFDILGLDSNDCLKMNRDECIKTINRSYKDLSLEFHPDKTSDTNISQYFPLISNVKDILKENQYPYCSN